MKLYFDLRNKGLFNRKAFAKFEHEFTNIQYLYGSILKTHTFV